MKTNNTMSKGAYFLKHLFYLFIGYIWYNNLLFECLTGKTYAESKFVFWMIIISACAFCYALTYEKNRTRLNVFINVLFSFGIYAVVSLSAILRKPIAIGLGVILVVTIFLGYLIFNRRIKRGADFGLVIKRRFCNWLLASRTVSATVAVVVIGAGMASVIMNGNMVNTKEREKEIRLQKEFEEYAASNKPQYTYPQEADEEHQGISVAYTSRVLKKKANNEKLTSEENELILNFVIQENGKGVAYTKFMEHGDGMGKSTRRVFETSDGGEHWNVINEGQYSFGYYDITYMDDVLIESAFGTTAEKGYFNISQDGGHTFESIPCEEIFNGGNRVVYPEKTGEDRQKKTVTYQWIDLYTKEVITKAEYDLKMNFIRNVN